MAFCIDVAKIDYLVAVRLGFPTVFWQLRSRVSQVLFDVNKWRYIYMAFYIDVAKIDYLVAVRLSFPTVFWQFRSRVSHFLL